MRIETVDFPYRKLGLDAKMFLPDTFKDQIPLVIKLNGMQGQPPHEEANRYAPWLTKQGIAFFAYDYPGVRNSQGKFDYFSAQESVDFAISLLMRDERINPLSVGLLGESFGGAMAIAHASRDDRVRALALRSPVFDTSYIAKMHGFEMLYRIWLKTGEMRFTSMTSEELRKEFSVQTRYYNPLNLAKQITVPVKMIVGKKDELLPIEGFRQLAERLGIQKNKKRYREVDKANHNFTNKAHFEMAAKEFTAFFRQVLKMPEVAVRE